VENKRCFNRSVGRYFRFDTCGFDDGFFGTGFLYEVFGGQSLGERIYGNGSFFASELDYIDSLGGFGAKEV